MSAANPIRNVSDTPWVAVYRADESERPDALFRDPSRRLAANAAAPRRRRDAGPPHGLAMVVRTAVMDEIVPQVREGAATVLNLAAGLDASLPPGPLPRSRCAGCTWTCRRWWTISRTHGGESPRCALEFIGADLREAAARAEVLRHAAARGPVLAITEACSSTRCRRRGRTCARPARRGRRAGGSPIWPSPPAPVRRTPSWSPALRAANAPFRFGSRRAPSSHPYGWRESEFRLTWDESLRLKRSDARRLAVAPAVALQSPRQREAGRRMSAIVLFERRRAGASPPPSRTRPHEHTVQLPGLPHPQRRPGLPRRDRIHRPGPALPGEVVMGRPTPPSTTRMRWPGPARADPARVSAQRRHRCGRPRRSLDRPAFRGRRCGAVHRLRPVRNPRRRLRRVRAAGVAMGHSPPCGPVAARA